MRMSYTRMLSSACLLAATAGAAALAQPVRLGTYICGGERQVVSRCGYSCQVDLPDRPLRNGLMQWDTVDPGPLAERLRACRHVDDPVNPPPAQNPRPATPTAPPPSPARSTRPRCGRSGTATAPGTFDEELIVGVRRDAAPHQGPPLHTA